MKRYLLLALLAALGQAQASTGVSCLLKTKAVSIYDQPFMQQLGRLRVLEVQDDRQRRNDFPCTQNFKKGMTLLVELGFNDMKIAMRYGVGQTVYLNFTYTDDRSGLLTRSYRAISAEEYAARQK